MVTAIANRRHMLQFSGMPNLRKQIAEISEETTILQTFHYNFQDICHVRVKWLICDQFFQKVISLFFDFVQIAQTRNSHGNL